MATITEPSSVIRFLSHWMATYNLTSSGLKKDIGEPAKVVHSHRKEEKGDAEPETPTLPIG
jgi:hypothetical protein